jgi:hypothetical protein
MRAFGVPWPTPTAVAKAIVAAHPALLTLDPTAAEIVAATIAAAPGLSTLATSISSQGSAKPTGGWATLVEVGAIEGHVATAYVLSPTTLAAAAPVLAQVILATQNDPLLQEQLWYPTSGQVGGYRVVAATGENSWEVVDVPTRYGVLTARVGFAAHRRRFQIQLGNLAPRSLSVYVEFLDRSGQAVVPSAWVSRLPAGVSGGFETATCKYLALLPPTRRIEGIPMPAADLELTFEQPPEAIESRLSFGGLGGEPWRAQVNALGAIDTAVLGYAVPALLQSAGIDAGVWYPALYAPGALLDQVLQAGMSLLETRSNVAAYAWLTAQIGPLVYGQTLPALQQILLKELGATALAAAAATITWAPSLLAVTNAPGTAISGSILASPASFPLQLSPYWVADLAVQLAPDPEHGAWPVTADAYAVDARWSDGAGSARSEVDGLATTSPQTALIPAVPANRAVALTATVTSAAGTLLASGIALASPSLQQPRSCGLVLREPLPTLGATTRWKYACTLAYTLADGHYWSAQAQPSATRKDLDGSGGGHHLEALVGLDLNAGGGVLAYAWQASGQTLALCGTSTPTDAQVHGFQTLGALADPQLGLVFASCAFSGQPNLAFAGNGGAGGYFIDPRPGVARLRRFQTGVPFDQSSSAPSYGRFNSPRLDDLLIHPAGFALGISYAGNAYESLLIGPSGTVADEPVAGICGGAGERPGHFAGPVALALAPGGEVLVLENGNRRIQAVDLYGNPVPYFGGSSLLVLVAESRPVTYLDLATDADGHLYVLLYLGNGDAVGDYRLDLYAADGRYLGGTPGVNAARIAVDRRRNVYTLDFAILLGPGERTEPGISVYAPHTV